MAKRTTLFASLEADPARHYRIAKAMKDCLNSMCQAAHVSKTEMQYLTGCGTHTCCDRVRNYQLKTLVLLFCGAAEVCGEEFDIEELLRLVAECSRTGKDLAVRMADPDGEVRPGESRILKRRRR